jgi:NitT/TauT family transport system permease protein
MSTSYSQVELSPPTVAPDAEQSAIASNRSSRVARSPVRWVPTIAAPIAAALAILAHYCVADGEPRSETHYYAMLLFCFAGMSVFIAIVQAFITPIRSWVDAKAPLIAAGIILLCVWEIITQKLALLPLPFFPGPEGVLQSLVNDRGVLLDSTYHSLVLLMGGYAAGVLAGLISGIIIGWFATARYWGMPILKIVGPIPATAWIPLTMIMFPSAIMSAVSLIALAVWFPVTMLTASGISNTRASYLDVARTLGAGRWYLIFRVAIPAAMPSIFVGLFMGLGSSFLTLIVAETVGVKAGLGWYVQWAQGWAEYGKVFAAIVIMAAFFSTIMTLLFKIRDRVLVWQKGAIKW